MRPAASGETGIGETRLDGITDPPLPAQETPHLPPDTGHQKGYLCGDSGEMGVESGFSVLKIARKSR